MKIFILIISILFSSCNNKVKRQVIIQEEIMNYYLK